MFIGKWRNWLKLRSKVSGRPRAISRRRCPLWLESLEERTTPSILFGDPGVEKVEIKDGGGPVINTVHVEVVFWGPDWDKPGTGNDSTAILNAFEGILSGSYTSKLKQYGNIDKGSLAPATIGTPAGITFETRSTPLKEFKDSDVREMLTKKIKDNSMPNEPGDDDQLFYFVVPQAGATGDGQTLGYHSTVMAGMDLDDNDDDPGLNDTDDGPSKVPFRYGWTVNDGTLDTITQAFSHELVEAITDPDGNGVSVTGNEAKPTGESEINEIADGNAQLYTYRLSNILVQSYWSAEDGRYIVPTGQAQNFSVSRTGTLTVLGDQLSSVEDSIATSASVGGGVLAALNGEVAVFEPNTITDVTIKTGAGPNTVNVAATAPGVPVTIISGGTDAVLVGNFVVGVQAILAAVTVTNPSGHLTDLMVDDSFDPAGRTATISDSMITGLAPAGAKIVYNGGQLHSLSIASGPATSPTNTFTIANTPDNGAHTLLTTLNTFSPVGAIDTILVKGTTGKLTINELRHGTNKVTVGGATVGNAFGAQLILGDVTVMNNDGLTDLSVDDSSNGDTAPQVTISETKITGLAPAAINYDQNHLNSLSISGGKQSQPFIVANTPSNVQPGFKTVLKTGARGDTVKVHATTGPLTIDGENVSNTVVLSDFGSVQAINGAVEVKVGPRGSTVLKVDDSADPVPQAPTIMAGSLIGLAPAVINYVQGNVNELTISGGRGGNTFTVVDTPSLPDGTGFTTLNTGAGADTVNVQATTGALTIEGVNGADTVNIGNAGSVQGITGKVVVNNAGGLTKLTVNDRTDVANRTVTISETKITGLAPADIVYEELDLSSLTINGGTGNNVFTINDTPKNGPDTLTTTLNSSTANDTITAGGTGGALVINGGGGSDTVTLAASKTGNLRADLLGAVNVTGPPASIQLIVDDRNDPAGQTWGITDAGIAGLTRLPITYTTAAITSLTANGGSGAATFNLTPSATVPFFINGNGPAQFPGDTLNLNLAGVAPPITRSSTGFGSGTVTFGNRKTVTYTGIEELIAGADLAVAFTNSPAVAAPGDSVAYTFVVTNNGPGPVTGATVTDTLPATLTGATWTCTASTGSSCAAASGAGDIDTTVTLLKGGTATFMLTATVNVAAPATLTDTATVAPPPDVFDPDLSNNSATATLKVVDPDVAFVTALYKDLLQRAPETDGLNGWVQALQHGVTRLQVASAIYQSPEHRGLQVDQDYLTYLHRSSDAVGRAGWVSALVAGVNENDVIRAFLNSPEYMAAHADATAFVTGLYKDVLTRAPDSDGEAGWLTALSQGASRDSVAVAFLTSAEAYKNSVDGFYLDYLGRAADSSGEAGWIFVLQKGLASAAQVAEFFLATDEFFAHSILP